MATQSSALTAMYEDVVADLVPFYENLTLLPNSQLILNSYNISGAVGNTMKIPVQSAFTSGNSAIGEGQPIISGAGVEDFATTSVALTVSKRGAGTFVTEESLEDIGVATITGQVLSQLSSAIALNTDAAGFQVMFAGVEGALATIADVDITVQNANATYAGNVDLGIVFSPEAAAYASKREPTLKMWNDVNNDRHEMVATVRNGFARVRPAFMQAIVSGTGVDAASAERASLVQISRAVAALRGVNAPTNGSGFYMSVVNPAQEFHISSQLNSVTQSTIGDLSMVGNQALVTGLIGQAVGVTFLRSNQMTSNLPIA